MTSSHLLAALFATVSAPFLCGCIAERDQLTVRVTEDRRYEPIEYQIKTKGGQLLDSLGTPRAKERRWRPSIFKGSAADLWACVRAAAAETAKDSKIEHGEAEARGLSTIVVSGDWKGEVILFRAVYDGNTLDESTSLYKLLYSLSFGQAKSPRLVWLPTGPNSDVQRIDPPK